MNIEKSLHRATSYLNLTLSANRIGKPQLLIVIDAMPKMVRTQLRALVALRHAGVVRLAPSGDCSAPSEGPGKLLSSLSSLATPE